MSNELHHYAKFGNLGKMKQVVEGGADIHETNGMGATALLQACEFDHFEIVVYLVEHGANVAHTDNDGRTALHQACVGGSVLSVKYLLGCGVNVQERSHTGRTALLYAAVNGNLEAVQYLLSSEGGASITETDDAGNSAFLLAARSPCHPTVVQWLLEYGGAQITDTNNEGASVWTDFWLDGLPNSLRSAYIADDDGEYYIVYGDYVPNVDMAELTAMLRVMVLHGGPPESLTKDFAPPLQQIVHDGARLRARLPAYLAQRRIVIDAHCTLLPPLQDLVNGYEEPTTTDELWATVLGASL
jgi:hypothetical protein